jgi:hypothetical protein
MLSPKQPKPAKTKTTATPVKDLQPAKDAKAGGGQKKEGPGITTVTSLT